MVWFAFGLGLALGVVSTVLYSRWQWGRHLDKLSKVKKSTKYKNVNEDKY